MHRTCTEVPLKNLGERALGEGAALVFGEIRRDDEWCEAGLRTRGLEGARGKSVKGHCGRQIQKKRKNLMQALELGSCMDTGQQGARSATI